MFLIKIFESTLTAMSPSANEPVQQAIDASAMISKIARRRAPNNIRRIVACCCWIGTAAFAGVACRWRCCFSMPGGRGFEEDLLLLLDWSVRNAQLWWWDWERRGSHNHQRERRQLRGNTKWHKLKMAEKLLGWQGGGDRRCAQSCLDCEWLRSCIQPGHRVTWTSRG